MGNQLNLKTFQNMKLSSLAVMLVACSAISLKRSAVDEGGLVDEGCSGKENMKRMYCGAINDCFGKGNKENCKTHHMDDIFFTVESSPCWADGRRTLFKICNVVDPDDIYPPHLF